MKPVAHRLIFIWLTPVPLIFLSCRILTDRFYHPAGPFHLALVQPVLDQAGSVSRRAFPICRAAMTNPIIHPVSAFFPPMPDRYPLPPVRSDAAGMRPLPCAGPADPARFPCRRPAASRKKARRPQRALSVHSFFAHDTPYLPGTGFARERAQFTPIFPVFDPLCSPVLSPPQNLAV